ncbi:histidine kinase-like protein 11 [Elsinoe australis]|uniref:histidine kinase n=1 Tax=Elsinoe australis TaxID=40998 RepID=A0A4U7AZ10_9PEZI|nr:histidine kinase-like protein 11 [Elsinoe australis]
MTEIWKTALTGPEDGPMWKADLLIRSRPSDEHRSTSSPPTTDRTSTTAVDRVDSSWHTLRDVGILQFWDVDARPTLAFQLRITDGRYDCGHQVYENAIFRRCYPDERRRLAFLSDAKHKVLDINTNILSFSIVSQGRPCTCTVLSGKWLLISWNTPADDRDIPFIETLGPRTIRSFAGDSLSRSSSFTGYASGDETWRTNAEILGWTKFPNFIITPHMKRVLEHPWHKTSMGAIETWSTVCKLSVSAMILNPDPRTLYWGSDFTTIYNEHCIPIYSKKHPSSLGSSPIEAWPETWSMAEPMFLKAMYEGKAAKVEGLQCFLMRNGTDNYEETFFDSTFLPIPGVDGGGNGVLNQFSEVTDQVIERRQQAVINGINASAWIVGGVSEYWKAVMETLDKEIADVPYAFLFTPTTSSLPVTIPGSAESTCYHLEHSIGLQATPLMSGKSFQLDGSDSPDDMIIAAIRQSHHKNDSILFLSKADGTLPEVLDMAVSDRGFGDVITAAAVLPMPSIQEGLPVGFLVMGLNPRRPVDSRTRTFVQVLRDSLTKAVATATLPSTQRNFEKQMEEIHQSLLQRLHQSTEESKRLESRFQRMYDTVPVGMYMFTPDGKDALYVNDEWCKLLEFSREQVAAGESWATRIHDDDLDKVLEAVGKLITEHTPMFIEFRTKNNWQLVDEVTGHPILVPQYLHATCIPEFDDDGQVLNLQGWLLNVSHDRFTQRLLSSRLDEVTASKQNAENFIDMVSHEMRNPLSAILQSADGIVSMLETSKHTGKALNMTEETADSVLDASETIILCAQHQKRIVDDILTLSKLDANVLVISPDKSSPSKLLHQALKMFEAQLDRADIRATVELEPSVSLLDIDSVMMDSSRILQVVINLLTNAIKFTQHAKKRAIALVLGASLTAPRDNDVHYIPRRETRPRHNFSLEWGTGQEIYLTFMVRDTGKGLTSEEMATLFQRFSQASPKTYKKYGGSGLGLFISRELCELQGGQIGVSSEAGRGSTFAFYVLTRRWLPCTPMSDSSARRYTDIHTPTMLESPVAYSRRESSAMFESTASLGSVAAHSSPIPSPDKERKEQPIKLSVLIVEDNVINQKVMAKQIRVAGHEVHVANHGLEALEFLRRTTYCVPAEEGSTAKIEQPDYLNQGSPKIVQGEAPVMLDVILMDLEMPVLDGLSCVKQIRMMQQAGEIKDHVPVIAVTANARSEQIGIALAAGMDEVVSKPCRIPAILERATGLVVRERGRRKNKEKVVAVEMPPELAETRIDSVLAGDAK